jgi:hypothetical protein
MAKTDDLPADAKVLGLYVQGQARASNTPSVA